MPREVQRQGTEICSFGALSPLDFFEFSPVDFPFFSRFTWQFNGEKNIESRLGHPQACAFPNVCLPTDIAPSSFSQGICRAGGQTLCVSTRPLVPGEAFYRIHRQSLNTHRGTHRSGGCPFVRNGPNTVSRSTVSNTELSECFGAH